MNTAISRIFVISAILFAALIVNLTWIMAVRADWYAERPENRRALAEELKIKRGVITGYDGSVIASSRRRSGYYDREYPQGALAPQLIGYTSVRYGRSGIEQQLNGELTGQTAALGLENWVDRLLGRRPEGAGVKLTLVPAVQKEAQQALRGQRGAIVVLDPKTGALIASASAPTFDPGELEDSWERLSQDTGAPLLNRVTQGLYTPGSAFKVVTATSGLDNGKVTPDTEFVDTGTYVVFGGKVTNYDGEVYGVNDFTTALTYSINTTFGKVGGLLGRKRLISSMERFGFYKTPPLALPQGEVLPSGRYDEKGMLSPDAFMDPLAVAWAACGQEQVLATPLQMALVAAGVANGGRIMEPYYLQEVVAASGSVVQKAQPEQWLVAMKPATALELSVMMQRVVNVGTGTAAALEGIQVAGKTGTAERGDGSNLAWFIAFAPADDPQVAIAVVIEDTQSTGGQAAAPLAAAVIKTALAQPDLP
ncbi:MAG TPA: penicillin-binding transpeptidase domain-containing protein [Thermoleophilia bacterium]|nr:penicillin-binding transpeptidase domain-containing protein [Thermoleophilia bacterium]